MKARYHHLSSPILTRRASPGFSRVMFPLVLLLMLFFLLPGLLAAQESVIDSHVGPDEVLPPVNGVDNEGSASGLVAGLNEQAVAAAVAAAQPGQTGEAAAPQVLSRELRTDRLWLLPRHAAFTDLMHRAGRQALQHPDCNEVLYGSLNEFRSERTGTSFTILCMRDARTTFNQVFFAEDLKSEQELTVVETPTSSVELERLRQMMLPSGQLGGSDSPDQNQPVIVPDDLPAPTVF